MKANSRCSILFHLLVPGGRWVTVIFRPVSLAKRCSSRFQSFTLAPLLPPQSAVIVRQRGVGITRLAKLLPPAPDALDRKGAGIGVDADADPAMVGGDVVDAIGGDLAQFGDLEVMHPHRLGLALGTQLTAVVLEVANQLLLLGVDGNRRLASGDRRFDRAH